MKNGYLLLTIKIISFVIAFAVSLYIFSEILNKGNTDMTAAMEEASLPLVYVQVEDYNINCLHGYVSKMNASSLRDSLTPIDSDRLINLQIDKYGALISGISFEVRSIDGKRLLEQTEITDYHSVDDTIFASFTMKDLMEENTEYNLDIVLRTGKGEEIHYYTRIVQAEGWHTIEKLNFVSYFNACTFSKEEAANITKYLESNSSGDNTTLGRVTLNCSFNQITWGDLTIDHITNQTMTIRELATDTATIRMDYIAIVSTNQNDLQYRVSEYYRVRYTKDRMYLLQFERTMSQIMNEKADIYTTGTITVGIQNEIPEIVECAGGDIFAFVSEDRLFCYNSSDNNLAYLYGFYDSRNWDARTIYDACDMEVLSVDETGNVRFIVYGYMNRGNHEGEVGVGIFSYNSLYNTVEEETFISYQQSWEMLKQDVSKLHFVSKDNLLYLYLDCNIYRVDLQTRQYEVVASSLTENSYEISNDNDMVLLQNGEDSYSATALTLLNLNTGTKTVVYAGTGNYIMPLGFMDNDIIYGIARQEDIVADKAGFTLFPMYSVRIQDEIGEVLKTYEQNNIYVTGGSIDGNQLVLTRVSRNETGSYISIEEDQILNNDETVSAQNTVTTPLTETYEKVVQINLANSMNVKTLKILTSKQILFEGNRDIAILENVNVPIRFTVFNLYGVSLITDDPSVAVMSALRESGTVINNNGNYIWSKANRSTINQIMAIDADSISEDRTSLAVCLDAILNLEGVVRNTSLMLENSETAIDILSENLTDVQVLELSGCSLEAMLFFLNRDIPVLGLLSNGEAVLLVGYNSSQIALLDPNTGTIYKKMMTDASEWFSENGNCFITYIRE